MEETPEIQEHRFDDDEGDEDAADAVEKHDPKEEDVREEDAVEEDDDEDLPPSSQPPGTQPAGTQPPSSQPPATQPARDDVEMAEPLRESSLTRRYQRIVSENGAPAAEAADWLARVLVDGPRAVAEILAVVVAPAAGGAGATAAARLVNQQMVMRNQPIESVRELCDMLAGDARDASAELATSRRAYSAYVDFWTRVAQESSDAILYDTDCFDTVLTWLEAFSTARLSMLRYAACLAAYSIVDGFIALGTRLRLRLVSLQKQLATEKKRCELGGTNKPGRRAKNAPPAPLSMRGKTIAKQVDDLSANNGELVELADKVFTGIFVLKYRDVAAEIRVASVQYLGKWIMRHPDHYLDDTHSKYIGWLLSDKDPLVRRSCIAALCAMLQQPDFFPSLELFLRRFLMRIVEMCRDKDNEVAVRAIRLCGLMIPYEFLDQDSVDQLCDQVMEESHAAIRKAAGQFLMLLIAENEEETPTSAKQSKKKSRKKMLAILQSEIPPTEKAKERLRQLVLILSREDAPAANAELVIDAVWEVMPSLRSWEAYTSLLIEGQSENSTPGKRRKAQKNDESLTEEEKALVCELLLEAAKKVLQEKPKSTGDKNSKDNESIDLALARVLAPMMPKLIVQFQGSSRALCALVQVPKYFSESHFETGTQREHFVNLLNRLVDAIARNTGSASIVQATVDTLSTMSKESHPLHEQTSGALLKASVAASKDLRQLVAAGVKKSGYVAIGAALLKTRTLSNLKELPEGTLSDVLSVLTAIVENNLPLAFNTSIALDACHTAVQQWAWCALRARSVFMSDRNDPDFENEYQEQTKKMWKTRDDILSCLCKFGDHPFNLRVRVSFATSLLAVLSIADGLSENLPKPSVDSNEDNGKDALDLPMDSSVLAVKECVLDLIISQYGFTARHPKPTRMYEDKRVSDTQVSEENVNLLCLGLAQVSIRRAVPDCYLHLPLLGFLLNRNRSSKGVDQLYKQFFERVLREQNDLHLHAVQALKEASEIEVGSRETKHKAVTLLATAILVTAPRKGHENFFADVLKALLSECKHSIHDADKAKNSVSILAKSNLYLATGAGAELCADVLVELREFMASVQTCEELDAGDRGELVELAYPIAMTLESISSGEELSIPALKLKRVLKGGTKVVKRAKARDRSEWDASPRAKANGDQELRRSKRQRKPVKLKNYEELDEDDLDEEEEEEAEEANDAEEVDQADEEEVDRADEEEVEGNGAEEVDNQADGQENEEQEVHQKDHQSDEEEDAKEEPGDDGQEQGNSTSDMLRPSQEAVADDSRDVEEEAAISNGEDDSKVSILPTPTKRRRGRPKSSKKTPRSSQGSSSRGTASSTPSRSSRRSSRRKSGIDNPEESRVEGIREAISVNAVTGSVVTKAQDISTASEKASTKTVEDKVANGEGEDDHGAGEHDVRSRDDTISNGGKRTNARRRGRGSKRSLADVAVVRRKRQRKW